MQAHKPSYSAAILISLSLCALAWWARPDSPADTDCSQAPSLAANAKPQTIERLFAAHGVLHLAGVGYRMEDGIIQSRDGIRTWVAFKPYSRQMPGAQATVAEHGTKVVCGTLRALALGHANVQHPQERQPEIQI